MAFCNMSKSFFDPQIERKVGSLASLTDVEKVSALLATGLQAAKSDLSDVERRLTSKVDEVKTNLESTLRFLGTRIDSVCSSCRYG